jgi:hypothetical protein
MVPSVGSSQLEFFNNPFRFLRPLLFVPIWQQKVFPLAAVGHLEGDIRHEPFVHKALARQVIASIGSKEI